MNSRTAASFVLIKLFIDYRPLFWYVLFIRCGVEDTRLEAKAKDTKKSEAKAKDSLFEDWGQTLSRPRTEPQVFFKKKGLQKSFSGNLQLIRVARIFDWGALNHKSDAMTSSKICLLALNQDFAQGEGLN